MLFLHHLSFLFGLYFAGKSLFTNWKYLSGCIRIVDKNTTKNESITLFKFLKVIPILSRFKVFTFEPSAKTLQSCLTLCDPIDASPPGSPVPGILQARTLEWVAISFSSAWKWKVKVKSLGRVQLFVTPWTAAYQAPPSMGFSRQEYWSGVPLG